MHRQASKERNGSFANDERVVGRKNAKGVGGVEDVISLETEALRDEEII